MKRIFISIIILILFTYSNLRSQETKIIREIIIKELIVASYDDNNANYDKITEPGIYDSLYAEYEKSLKYGKHLTFEELKEVTTSIDEIAKYPGGYLAMNKYFSANFSYPRAAWRAQAQGIIFIKFIINEDGKVFNVQTIKGIGFGCDEEVVTLVERMPDWNPGKKNNKNIMSRMEISLRIQFDKKTKRANLSTSGSQ